MGYLVLTSERGRQQYWLTFALTDGWIAAYRLTYHGEGRKRRAQIVELRIVPGLTTMPERTGGPTGDFEPLRDSASAAERYAQLAGRGLPPFSFEIMRRRLTARRFADGLAAVGSLIGRDEPDFDPREYGDPPARLKGSAVRRPGRPRVRPPAFYAKFALRYEYIENVSRREPGDSTRELLARQYKVPLTTIGKWIRVARQRGFLTKVVRGQRGGQATRRAHDVNAREEKK